MSDASRPKRRNRPKHVLAFDTLKCVESRATKQGWRKRRYITQGAHLTTVEVPMTVIKAVGEKRVLQAMEDWRRGQEARQQAAAVRAIVESNPDALSAEVARLSGRTEQRVRQIRKELAAKAEKK